MAPDSHRTACLRGSFFARREKIPGLTARTSAGLFPDQETHACGDGESRRDDMKLSQRDSKYADDSDEDQVNGEQKHSEVLFHVNKGRGFVPKNDRLPCEFLPVCRAGTRKSPTVRELCFRSASQGFCALPL